MKKGEIGVMRQQVAASAFSAPAWSAARTGSGVFFPKNLEASCCFRAPTEH